MEITVAASFSSYTVEVNPNRIFANSGINSNGQRVRINNYTFSSPDAFNIDGSGQSVFFVGARANTRRSGQASYPELVMTGDTDIEVTFMP